MGLIMKGLCRRNALYEVLMNHIDRDLPEGCAAVTSGRIALISTDWSQRAMVITIEGYRPDLRRTAPGYAGNWRQVGDKRAEKADRIA